MASCSTRRLAGSESDYEGKVSKESRYGSRPTTNPLDNGESPLVNILVVR